MRYLQLGEVEILVGNRPLAEYLHDGRYFVEGAKDIPFSVSLSNTSRDTLLVVLEVNGVSVSSGTLPTTVDQGYLIPPHHKRVITRWCNGGMLFRFGFFLEPIRRAQEIRVQVYQRGIHSTARHEITVGGQLEQFTRGDCLVDKVMYYDTADGLTRRKITLYNSQYKQADEVV